jgi:SRSO17 transposase
MPRSPAPGGWEAEFAAWLEPFLAVLPRCTHRKWAPRYVEGLLGPTERKNVERLADALARGDYDRLHHFLTTTAWDAAPLLRVLAESAQAMVGGPDAVLIIDDTTLLKQGTHSVGVARQYSGRAGKLTNCQTRVSLTLAKGEVPVPVALRPFLPASWAGDLARCAEVGIPPGECVHKQKWQLALAELDRGRAAGVEFGPVLADAGYGRSVAFRRGLAARGLTWAVGVLRTQRVYPVEVAVTPPREGPRGRPQRYPVPTVRSLSAEALIDGVAASGRRAFRALTWRAGTKGPLVAEFAAVRVKVADGPRLARGRRHPGEVAWLVGERRPSGARAAPERRPSGERKYYLTNHPPRTPLRTLARAVKARWSCEQAHQQMKEELGLDHFEGRGWTGLHHHALLTMIAYSFLQHYRLTHRTASRPARGENRRRPTARPEPPGHPPPPARGHLASTHLPPLRYANPASAA